MASNMTHDMQIRVSKVTYFLKYHIIWGNYHERKDILMYSSAVRVLQNTDFPRQAKVFVSCPIEGKESMKNLWAKDEKLPKTDAAQLNVSYSSNKKWP